MMMLALLIALQAAPPADIEFHATVRARSLTIEKAGTAEVTVTANNQNIVSIEGPEANGRKRIANPVFTVEIQARIADPEAPPHTNIPQPD